MRVGLVKSKGCALDAGDFAGGDHAVIHRRVARGSQPEDVIERGAAAGEVEIGMAGQIDGSGLVGGRGEVEAQLVRIGQGVNHLGGEVAREAALAGFAQVGQFQSGGVFGRGQRARLPDRFSEHAVQVIGAVVGDQLVFDAIEGEAGIGNAIGHATHDRSDAAESAQILFQAS